MLEYIIIFLLLLQNLFCKKILCACIISSLEKPCPRCDAPPYGFKNVMSLNNDPNLFAVSPMQTIQHHNKYYTTV